MNSLPSECIAHLDAYFAMMAVAAGPPNASLATKFATAHAGPSVSLRWSVTAAATALTPRPRHFGSSFSATNPAMMAVAAGPPNAS